MSAQHHEPSSHRISTWLLAAFGALAVASLIAAMVVVVQEHMQQVQVMKAQWTIVPRAGPAKAPVPLENPATDQTGALARQEAGNGAMPASFDRP